VPLLVLGVAFLNKEIVEEKLSDNSDKEAVRTGYILAELGHAPGAIKRMTLVSPKAIEEKSRESIDSALLVIKELSEKVADAMEETPAEQRPSQMQMAFNLLLTTNGRAVITKSEKELNFKVTLVWRSEWNGEGGGNL
jgi:microsomal dipeptidase-like Zn-dependent dipeptidase